jgi:hypothetical protein
MPVATLYKASGEAVPIQDCDYTLARPGIAYGALQPQITLRHIAELIHTCPNDVLFCESHTGQRIAYAADSYTKEPNAFAASNSVLKLHGDVVEIPYSNSLDY